MIRWSYIQLDLFTYRFIIKDEFNNSIYSESEISAPAMSILKELLTDYLFAKEIGNTERVFNYDTLSDEDKMDLKLIAIHKLEDVKSNYDD